MMERNGRGKEKEGDMEIGDWIMFEIGEGKVMSRGKELVEGERMVEGMIEKNGVVEKVIEDLEVVVVGGCGMGKDDEKGG